MPCPGRRSGIIATRRSAPSWYQSGSYFEGQSMISAGCAIGEAVWKRAICQMGTLVLLRVRFA